MPIIGLDGPMGAIWRFQPALGAELSNLLPVTRRAIGGNPYRLRYGFFF